MTPSLPSVVPGVVLEGYKYPRVREYGMVLEGYRNPRVRECVATGV